MEKQNKQQLILIHWASRSILNESNVNAVRDDV